MNNLYFYRGFFIGTLFTASITCLLTNMYIDKYYILTPKNMASMAMASYIESYTKYEK
jgi:hypothetical protein